jgi:hypothetical protein
MNKHQAAAEMTGTLRQKTPTQEHHDGTSSRQATKRADTDATRGLMATGLIATVLSATLIAPLLVAGAILGVGGVVFARVIDERYGSRDSTSSTPKTTAVDETARIA